MEGSHYLVPMSCVLCHNSAPVFFEDETSRVSYSHCTVCDLRFADPETRLKPDQEFERYQLHRNDIYDPGYQKFVDPMFQLITKRFPDGGEGLDFGCGPGPVLAHMLKDKGFDITLYDPFFHDDKSALEKRYDFVFAIEVAEHFYFPADEFAKLKELVLPKGGLGIMTSICDDALDFANWYYRRDPTHVCFYSESTFEWIRTRFAFKSFQRHGDRVAWFEV